MRARAWLSLPPAQMGQRRRDRLAKATPEGHGWTPVPSGSGLQEASLALGHLALTASGLCQPVLGPRGRL